MIIISMFDESGVMVRPWATAGHTCYCLDLLNDGRREDFEGGGSIEWIRADLMPDDWQQEGALNADLRTLIDTRPDMVFGFGPCTDLAVAGARHFKAKRAVDPDFQRKALALWRTTETVGNILGVPWFAENPKSVISTMYRKPDYKFDPSDFGGYLSDDHKHSLYPDIFPPRDAYPKDTWIWCGNGFRFPQRKPVPSIRDFPGWTKLGGKSARTKRIRSTTPEGWANAVFIANSSFSY